MAESMSYNVWAWAKVMLRTVAAHVWCMPACAPEGEEMAVLQEEGKGLIVVLHGYNQSRSSLLSQWAVLQAGIPPTYHSVYIPRLHYEGSSNLLCLEGNGHVLSTMQEWCANHPTEPILLIGISLGGRIAIGLQHALRYAAEHQHIHVITLGSPLRGTALLSLLPGGMPLWRLLLGEGVAAELDPDEASPQQVLLGNMMVNKALHRSFCHFYSRTDHLVFPPSRCVTDQSVFLLSDCAHREMLTHPDVIGYIASFVFPP